ncbi:unnamed protein product [Linum tenue]|uniref:TF-B3 domain-containing protein n=1 Tax=Linum tenue TaxID=586396 RepID=A0AAV0RQS6_9ROSI|nr:unnamed protein product [Linum tenue]
MTTMEQEGQEAEKEANACKTKNSSWEEDFYWTHFQFTHFFRFLHAGFHRTLALPKKFSGRLKAKLPETVTLTGPSRVKWTVGLTTTTLAEESTVSFSRGWSEFAADNSLQVDDLLVFKYNGESRFDVLILETGTSCEKPAAYFAKKGKTTGENFAGVHVSPASPPAGDDNIGADGIPPPPEKYVEIVVDDDEPTSSTGQPVSSGVSNKRTNPKLKRTKLVVEQYDRYVTEESKRKAVTMARFAAGRDCFISVMKTSSVCKTFYLSVPSAWMKKHLNYGETQELILRVGENEWPVKFRPRKKKGWGGLGGGWRIFAQDNNLQPFDVCLFQPSSATSVLLNSAAVVLEVKIFRCS